MASVCDVVCVELELGDGSGSGGTLATRAIMILDLIGAALIVAVWVGCDLMWGE